jgi:hypothetical protein
LLLYDIAEEFDLDELRRLLGTEPQRRSPGFKLPAPDYVRFERLPVLEKCEPIHLATGEYASASLRYFDYGVVTLEIEVQFENEWPGLIAPVCNPRSASPTRSGWMRPITLSICKRSGTGLARR